VETVRFTGKAEPPVEWQAPPSWDKEVTPGKELRYATFHLGGKGKPPQLTVFRFEPGSGLAENVAPRGRIDLGRPSPRPPELEKAASHSRAGPHRGVRVAPSAPGPGRGAHPPMPAAGAPPAPRRPRTRPLPLRYAAPAGWTETGPRSAMGITILTTFE